MADKEQIVKSSCYTGIRQTYEINLSSFDIHQLNSYVYVSYAYVCIMCLYAYINIYCKIHIIQKTVIRKLD